MNSFFQETALEHLDGLFAYAMALTHNKPEAEDLVQETYLRAVRASGRLKPESNIRAWLYTILHNLHLNRIRHRRTAPPLSAIDAENDRPQEFADRETPNPLDRFLTKETRWNIRRAVASLPPFLREIVVLREFHGLSYSEIGQILGCPIGTVMSRLGRAREKLRTLLLAQDGKLDECTTGVLPNAGSLRSARD